MSNRVHGDFIITPISNILLDGIFASASIKAGAESYPLGEYFFQSLFLRMTGAQEQKLKCICWEMATDDYTYRYDLLHKKNYGECSNYSEKNSIYKDLIEQIRNKQSDFSIYQIWEDATLKQETIDSERKKWEKKVEDAREKQAKAIIEKREEESGNSLSEEEKNKIINGLKNGALPEEDFRKLIANIKKKAVVNSLLQSVQNLLSSSQIVFWKQAAFDEFCSYWSRYFKPEWITPDNSKLMESSFQKFYEEVVYIHRNRCAHNTNSYQQNLPSLNTIAGKNYSKQNYFYRFVMLILIDEVFVRLYKRYVSLIESSELF